MSDLLLIVAAGLWGAAAGALLPRAVYRFSVPSEESQDGWRGSCPDGHPVKGWIGRSWCGDCAGTAVQPDTGRLRRTATTPSYGPRALPLTTVTALLCAALAAATGTRPELGVWLLLGPVGVLLAAVDFRVQRLPDPLTLPLAAAALALLGLAALLPEHAGDWTTAVLASFVLSACYLVLHLVNPGGMGFGDVKLALGIGAALGWYGWATVMLGTFAGFLLGALYAGALVVARRADRKTAIPFGPFLIAGAFVGLLVGAY